MSRGSSGRDLEEVRRSQLISPYGIGALMPTLTGETYIIAGLDKWSYGPGENTVRAYLVEDDRLIKRLKVKELRLPPEYKTEGERSFRTIPVYRFPGWYYCPTCGSMEKLSYETPNRKCNSTYTDGKMTKCSERKYKQYLVPERLVMVCAEGHISDVDFMTLVHENNPSKKNPNTCRIRRETFGSSGSITNLRYTCSCGETFRFNNSYLVKEFKCSGAKPWLGIDELNIASDNCSSPMKITQSGSLNVWYPETVNSILIPPDDDEDKKIVNLINQHRTILMNAITNGEISEFVIEMVFKGLNKTKVDEYLRRMIFAEDAVQKNMTESEYRYTEYKALVRNYGRHVDPFFNIRKEIDDYESFMKDYFSGISIVKKLKETRVFTGFSRIMPRGELDLSFSKLSNDPVDWLPAIEVYGEGIFIQFNSSSISAWKQRVQVEKRVNKLNRNYRKTKGYDTTIGDIRPEYAMLHTFAHLLVNQLSYECGYSAASIREKIYCLKGENEKNGNNEMYGILLYTASGDSEGSLGGLSRMGNPGYLEKIIINAIENAKWCSADPVCIQTNGQGPESANLAACYNCALLPETSCENGNRLLDRALVTGELDMPETGYFHDIEYM